MAMANTVLNADCVQSTVQNILCVSPHVLNMENACEAENINDGTQVQKSVTQVKVNQLVNGGLLPHPGVSGSRALLLTSTSENICQT